MIKFLIVTVVLCRPHLKDPCMDYRDDFDNLDGKVKYIGINNQDKNLSDGTDF